MPPCALTARPTGHNLWIIGNPVVYTLEGVVLFGPTQNEIAGGHMGDCLMQRLVHFALAGLFVSAGWVGCASKPAPNNPTVGVNADGSPKWVNRGSGAYDAAKGKAFYGVGIVQGVRNEALARQTADNRARGEIGKMFDLYVAAMMKDYQRSTTAGDFKSSSEEQDVVAAQKTITEVTLRGVEIRDHWINPQSGALYALAVLDLEGIMKSLQNARELNTKVRDYVRANARRAFNDLDKELGKRRAAGK
jgi:hypothetical protein